MLLRVYEVPVPRDPESRESGRKHAISMFQLLGRDPKPNERGVLSTNSQGLGAQIDRETISTRRAPIYGCQARNSNRRVLSLLIATIRDYIGVMEKKMETTVFKFQRKKSI